VAGELVRQTDAKNQTTTFAYDPLSRLIEKNNTGSPMDERFAYNALILHTAISDPLGRAVI
jgi:YD repeat-containing protein